MMTIPMAKKLGAPIFLKKSEKYSIVSIVEAFYKNPTDWSTRLGNGCLT